MRDAHRSRGNRIWAGGGGQAGNGRQCMLAAVVPQVQGEQQRCPSLVVLALLVRGGGDYLRFPKDGESLAVRIWSGQVLKVVATKAPERPAARWRGCQQEDARWKTVQRRR